MQSDVLPPSVPVPFTGGRIRVAIWFAAVVGFATLFAVLLVAVLVIKIAQRTSRLNSK
jgi:hypothetical protein